MDRYKLPEGCPTDSIWGPVQHGHEVLAGHCYGISTAGHGGYWLSGEYNDKIPEPFRMRGGWYEEDVNYAIVHYFLPELFVTDHEAHMAQEDHDKDKAEQVLKTWLWRQWETYTGETLVHGVSWRKDEEMDRLAHANDYIVISAFGDWKEGVPKGMVGVVTTKGGIRAGYYKAVDEPATRFHEPEHKYFLVEKNRYENEKQPCGFVIDLGIDKEVPVRTFYP